MLFLVVIEKNEWGRVYQTHQNVEFSQYSNPSKLQIHIFE